MKSFYDYLYMGIKENLQKLFEKPENIEIINEQHTEVLMPYENTIRNRPLQP